MPYRRAGEPSTAGVVHYPMKELHELGTKSFPAASFVEPVRHL